MSETVSEGLKVGHIEAYYERLAAEYERFFALLAEEPFNIGGAEAERAGWFIEGRARVELAVALKIAELIDLPEEERLLLAQAAIINGITKRIQNDLKRQLGAELTDAERREVEDAAEPILIARGIDPRAVRIAQASHGRFPLDVARGLIPLETAEDQTVFKLALIFSYAHNVVETEVTTNDAGMKAGKSYITDYVPRLENAAVRNPKIATETAEFNGEQLPFYILQTRIVAVTEAALEDEIAAQNPEAAAAFKDGVPLWQFLKEELERDAE